MGGFVYVLAPCGSLQKSLLWGWEFLLLQLPCPQVFSQRFEASFPDTRTMGCAVCLTLQLFFQVYLHTNVGLHSPPATALLWVLFAHLPISALPTVLDECFFFNCLVVRLPYSSIFCQFWLFLVFKLFLSFFWLYKEAQCIYLCLHLGRKFNRYYFWVLSL